MFWLVILGIVLYFLCAVLFVVEVFVPSFGLLTIMALAALVGGVMVFFGIGPNAGWLGVVIAVIEIPIVFVIAYKIFPNTGFGKTVILSKPRKKPGEGIPDNDAIHQMVGKIGTAVTILRPVGMVDFSGHRLECVSESGYVKRGTQVEVIKADGTQLTVRPIESE